MSEFILILISTVLVNNVIVGQVIGTDPALAFIQRMDVAFGMACTMIILLPLVTTCTYFIHIYLLVPYELNYLRLLVFVSIILLLIQCIKQWGHLFSKNLIHRVNIFLPLAGINTAVLGTVLLGHEATHGLIQLFAFGLGSGIGFSFILLMLTAIHNRLEVADIPVPFRGMPIILITLGLISMALLGFIGLIQF